MDEQSEVKKADVGKPSTAFFSPKKREYKSSAKAGVKKFRNLGGSPISIGFKGRTVTWQPFGIQELRLSEYENAAFKRRINEFKEVK